MTKLYIVTIQAPDSYPDADERYWSKRVEAQNEDDAIAEGKRRYIAAGAPADIEWKQYIVIVTAVA